MENNEESTAVIQDDEKPAITENIEEVKAAALESQPTETEKPIEDNPKKENDQPEKENQTQEEENDQPEKENQTHEEEMDDFELVGLSPENQKAKAAVNGEDGDEKVEEKANLHDELENAEKPDEKHDEKPASEDEEEDSTPKDRRRKSDKVTIMFFSTTLPFLLIS